MKFTINLRPTLAIKREPSHTFLLAQAAMVAIPLIAFAVIGFFYWNALARQEELAKNNADVDSQKSKLKKERKKGLKEKDRQELFSQRDALQLLFNKRVPTTAKLLADLEESFPAECKATWLSLERQGEGKTFKVQLRGNVPRASTVADLSQAMQKLPRASVTVHSLRRKKDHWRFELSSMVSVKFAEATTEAAAATLLSTSEVLVTTAPVAPAPVTTGGGQ